ncbi:MAG: hypothetical protein ACE5F1_03640 [Planctomycetota bacterium]
MKKIRSVRPEGMYLYALSELTAEPPHRRFDFTNWDDEGDAMLQILARSFGHTEE